MKVAGAESSQSILDWNELDISQFRPSKISNNLRG